MNEPHGTPRGGYHGLEFQRGLVASFSSAAFGQASAEVKVDHGDALVAIFDRHA